MKNFFKILTGHFLPSSDNAYRPHLLRKPWLLFFLTVVLASEGLYIGSLAMGQSAGNLLSAVLPGEIISLTNVQRTDVGDGTLTENAELDAAAQAKANDMAAKGYFSHVGPDGKEPWAWISEAGYDYHYAGENLAVRFDNSSDVVNAWMASPTHKANIVKPVYTEIGVGVADGMYEGSPATFVVQYFGTPMPAQEAAAEQSQTVPPTPAQARVAGASVEETNQQQVKIPSSTPPASSASPQEETNVSGAPSSGFSMREVAQTFLRANDASQASSAWVIGGIATFLLLLLALAFFVHIEIQPVEMLLGGAIVAAVAFSLMGINSAFYAAKQPSQSAAALNALAPAVLVGEDAASVVQEFGG